MAVRSAKNTAKFRDLIRSKSRTSQSKGGNELDLQTVGQVAEKMTRENYLKSRRNPKTFNKNEIEKLLTEWFSNDLDLDKSKLTREAKFV